MMDKKIEVLLKVGVVLVVAMTIFSVGIQYGINANINRLKELELYPPESVILNAENNMYGGYFPRGDNDR